MKDLGTVKRMQIAGSLVKGFASLRCLYSAVMLVLLLQPAFAGIDIYQFENRQEEQRFRKLIAELRCPKCQNQNLADSNAGLAKDLKDRTYQLLKQGKSNQEIKTYLVDRYGDFIIYQPPFRVSTWLLWLGPLLVFMVVLGIFLVKRLRYSQSSPQEITMAEQQRLEALLDDADASISPDAKQVEKR